MRERNARTGSKKIAGKPVIATPSFSGTRTRPGAFSWISKRGVWVLLAPEHRVPIPRLHRIRALCIRDEVHLIEFENAENTRTGHTPFRMILR